MGKYNGELITLNKGPYGFYLEYDKKKFSTQDGSLNKAEAIKIIDETKSNIINEFKDISVRNGPYGPYIKKGSKFTPVPKDREPAKLTKKDCLEIIKDHVPTKYNKGKGKKNYNKK